MGGDGLLRGREKEGEGVCDWIGGLSVGRRVRRARGRRGLFSWNGVEEARGAGENPWRWCAPWPVASAFIDTNPRDSGIS